MKRFRILLPLANWVLFLVVASVYIATHGGWEGDARSYFRGGDVIVGPEDVGLVFFNRWTISDSESALTLGFIFVNIVPVVAGNLTLATLGAVFEEFQAIDPLGLSRASYTLVLALAFSVAQWFGVGVILDRRRERTRRTRIGALGRGTTGALEP